MIRSWLLENFKSAGDLTRLDFAPLTVFAGPNSSGKSTIIQSILLTAQTLQSSVVQRPVILNGHMARLGSYTDIVTGADERVPVTLGFRASLRPEILYRPARGGVWHDFGSHFWPPDQDSFEVQCQFTFSMRGQAEEVEALRLQPRLERSLFKTIPHEPDQGKSYEITLQRSKDDASTRLSKLGIDAKSASTAGELLRFEVAGLTARDPAEFGPDSLENATVAGAALRHFLPDHLAVVYDAVETEVRRVVDSLTASGTRRWRLDEDISAILDQTAVRSVIEAVLSDFEDEHLKSQASSRRLGHSRHVERIRQLVAGATRSRGSSVARLRELMVALPPPLRGELEGLFAEREEALGNAVRRGRQPKFELTIRGLPSPLAAAVSATGRFFAGSVQYLGPLRDEPKSVYPLAGTADPTDVGLRGEHTAAVLEVHRNTEVLTIDPSYFAQDVSGSPKPLKRSLVRATRQWLDYMGVGTDVTTEDRGKLGHELKVAIGKEGPKHDLTQVGVGVSQVLPIIVLSLMAEPGATLILEQPELHLHPRVQTRLADFFVALTLMGKQCVVETHSEYLINQLRYRAVISEGTSVSSMLRIYFVEKREGQSTYRPVHINSYGVIEDWPAGFFDEKERTAAKIMRAAMEKRYRQHGR